MATTTDNNVRTVRMRERYPNSERRDTGSLTKHQAPWRSRFATGTLRHAFGTRKRSWSSYPFLDLALLDDGHAKAALAAMLGCVLDVAKLGVLDGCERALGVYHQLPLEQSAL